MPNQTNAPKTENITYAEFKRRYGEENAITVTDLCGEPIESPSDKDHTILVRFELIRFNFGEGNQDIFGQAVYELPKNYRQLTIPAFMWMSSLKHIEVSNA